MTGRSGPSDQADRPRAHALNGPKPPDRGGFRESSGGLGRRARSLGNGAGEAKRPGQLGFAPALKPGVPF